MEKLAHANLLEKSKHYLDLSPSLLTKIDLYLCNTDLTTKQKESLIKILEETYSEGYVNSITD